MMEGAPIINKSLQEASDVERQEKRDLGIRWQTILKESSRASDEISKLEAISKEKPEYPVNRTTLLNLMGSFKRITEKLSEESIDDPKKTKTRIQLERGLTLKKISGYKDFIDFAQKSKDSLKKFEQAIFGTGENKLITNMAEVVSQARVQLDSLNKGTEVIERITGTGLSEGML